MTYSDFRKAVLFSVGLGALMVHSPQPVLAQGAQSAATEDLAIEEIVVRSRYREERVQDVPATVSVFSQTQLRQAGVQRAEDFISMTPGVSIVDAAEVGDTQVNIRGINGARDAENSFAFVLDGIVMTNPAAFNREFSDLQQIEILKGPQGAIYGRNAAAGAILVSTRMPGNEFEANFTGSAANDESFFGQGRVAGPLVEDVLSASLAFDYRTTDGFYRNVFLQRDDVVDAFENYNINGRLVWRPQDNVTVDVKTRYGEVDASAITFNATFHLDQFAAGFMNPTAFEDVNIHEFQFNPNIISDNDQNAFELSTKVDWTADWGNVTAWLLYSDIDNKFIADGTSGAFGFFQFDPACIASTQEFFLDAAAGEGFAADPGFQGPQILGATPTPILVASQLAQFTLGDGLNQVFGLDGNNALGVTDPFAPRGSFFGPYTPTTCDGIQEQVRNQSDISGEVRIASRDDQRMRWLAGAYFLSIDRRVGVSLNRDSGDAPIRGLVQAAGTPNSTEALLHDRFDSTVFALFGQLQFDVTEDVELSLALRYDNESRDVSNLVPSPAEGGVTTFLDLDGDGIPGDPLNPAFLFNDTIPDQSRTFEEVQPKISATWDVTDELTLFGSWGKGFKSGGFNNVGSELTIDLFINGFIAPFLDDPRTPEEDLRPLVQIEDIFEKETSSAFEAGFKGRLFDNRVSVEGAFYYVDVDNLQTFEFFVGPFGLLRIVNNIENVDIKGFELASTIQLHDYVSVYGGFNVIDSEIKRFTSRPDTVGNESPYTPDYTINAGGTVNFPLPFFGGGLNWFTRVDAQVVGPTWFHAVQDQTRPTINSIFIAGDPLFGAGVPSFCDDFVVDFVTGGTCSPAFGDADFSNSQREAYHTIDLRAGIQGETWEFIGFVDNLTEEKYLEEVIPAPEFGGSFIHPGSLRRWGFEFTKRF